MVIEVAGGLGFAAVAFEGGREIEWERVGGISTSPGEMAYAVFEK